MAIKSQGTQIWVATKDAPTVYTEIGCPSDVTGLGGSRTQIDVTCLSASEAEFLSGLGQPGQVTVDINFDPSDASHIDLWDYFDSGEMLDWVIGLSDGTVDPDATMPATRSWIEFEGYVADLTIDIATDDAVRGSMSIQRSGSRKLTPKT